MIAPTDSGILYSPYTWEVTSARAKTINAGAYFRTMIVGNPSSVVLNFDLSGIGTPLPKVTWEIDGWTSTTVDVASSITVPLPSANTWGKHNLKVTVEATAETVDRWNTQASAVQFTGITTTGTATLPPVRPLKALVLGDSIVEGVRTLNMTATNTTDRSSSRATWAYQLGDVLDAEVGVVGFGSTGLTHGGAGNAPRLSGFWNQMWSGGPSRGVASTAPDYVVINQGTNDTSATDITTDYTLVLNSIITATSGALIFCMLPFRPDHASEIQAAIAACTNPARCVYVDTTGWWNSADAPDALHPYGYVAPDLARRTANAIKAAAGTAPVPVPQPVSGYFFDINLAAVPMSLAIS